MRLREPNAKNIKKEKSERSKLSRACCESELFSEENQTN